MPDQSPPRPPRPSGANRRVEQVRAEILERTKMQIAARLQRVCSHMEPAEFDALVTRAAEIEVRFRMRREQDVSDAAKRSKPAP